MKYNPLDTRPQLKPDPLEKDIEKTVCEYAKSLGCLVYKFTSPSRRSVPDRLFILPDGKGVFFIEFKRRGQKPTAGQAVEIEKIRAKKARVYVVDDKQKGKEILNFLIEWGLEYTTAPAMSDPFFN